MYTHRKQWRVMVRVALAMVAAGIMTGTAAHATGTAAGTSISNQAVVTYKDAEGVDQPAVTSNIVTTTVAQAYGVDVLTANTPQNVLKGTIVYYPITVTNTGNGADIYDLTASGTQGTWTRSIYLDTNGNGVVDPGEPAATSTGVIDADASKKFVVALNVPDTAAGGSTDTMTVTADSSASGAPAADAASVTDVTNVTSGAVINGTKAATPAVIDPLATGAAARTVTYTLTLTNTGGSTATNVVAEDVIPTSPALVTLAGAGSSSVGTITYYNSQTSAYEAYAAGNLSKYTKIKVSIAQMVVNETATATFQVVVPLSAPPGNMQNTASVSADDLATVPTNTTSTSLKQSADLTISAAAGQSTTAGGSVSYTHTITNAGNGVDVINVTTPTVPAGWIARLFNADGVTPLADSNGDGIPDTGTLAAAGTRDIIVRVTSPTTVAIGDYDVVVSARSTYDALRERQTTDTTTVTKNPKITLTKGVSNAAPLPGEVITYTIGYTVADASAFETVVQDAVPAGTSLVAGSISGTGTLVGGLVTWNLGTLANPSSGTLTFDVKVNSDLAVNSVITNSATADYRNEAGTQMTPATATAPNATVAAKAGVTLTPNNTGNAGAGATQTYAHVLTNTGNSTDAFTISVASPHTWPYTVFLDVNGDGLLQPADTLVTGAISLASGASQKLLVRVQVPAGTPAATNDNAAIKATSALNVAVTATSQDATTVVAAAAPLLDIRKEGAVDTAAGAYTGPDGVAYNNSDGVARPGATLVYTISYTNRGAGSATTVVIKDQLPANTTLVADSITGGGTESGGTITWNIGTLAPAGTGSVTFKVTIN